MIKETDIVISFDLHLKTDKSDSHEDFYVFLC